MAEIRAYQAKRTIQARPLPPLLGSRRAATMRHITVTTTSCCCFRSVCSPCAHNLLHKRLEWPLEVTTAPRKYYTYAKVVHNSAGRARRARISGEQALRSNRCCASQLDGEIANTLHTVTCGGP